MVKRRRIYQIIDQLAVGYELQLLRFQEMRELAWRQQELTKAESSHLLDKILVRRQALMKEIDETNKKLVNLREDAREILHFEEFSLSKLRELIHTPRCEKLSVILPKLAGIIEEIQALDWESKALLENHLKEIRQSLQGLWKFRKAHHTYKDEFSSKARFLDVTK